MRFISKNYAGNNHRIQPNEPAAKLWIISKKLETAYMKMHEGTHTADIYIEVGYKDVARFIKAFEQQYGFPPSFDLDTLN